MTVISINVVDVAGEYSPGDVVNLRSPVLRGDGDHVVQTAWHSVPLSEGGVGSVTVSPGPLEVQLDCRGVSESTPLVVTVPDVESITLRELLEQSFTYEPPVVSEVATLASRAESAADRAETVADTFGSLEGVAASVQAAEDAAASAEADRLVVEQAATSASWSGDRLTVLGATSPPLTGEPGPAGATPHIGPNGTWWVGSTDTGIDAQGPKGDPGDGAGDVTHDQLSTALSAKADLVGGVVPTSQIPAVALTVPHVVADRAEMLALSDVQEGDVAVVTGGADIGTYMLSSGDPSAFSSWVRLTTPEAPVQSVNGQTGTVVLGAGDVGARPETWTPDVSEVTNLPSISTSASGSVLVRRTSGGQVELPSETPTLTQAVRRSYLESVVGTRAPTDHTHAEYIEGYVVTSMPSSPVDGAVYFLK